MGKYWYEGQEKEEENVPGFLHVKHIKIHSDCEPDAHRALDGALTITTGTGSIC